MVIREGGKTKRKDKPFHLFKGRHGSRSFCTHSFVRMELMERLLVNKDPRLDFIDRTTLQIAFHQELASLVKLMALITRVLGEKEINVTRFSRKKRAGMFCC